MMEFGIVLSSFNNYDMLQGEIIPQIENFKGIIVNVDDQSTADEIEKGKRICEVNNIVFIESEQKGVQFSIDQAVKYLHNKGVTWSLVIQHDVKLLGDDFFDRLNDSLDRVTRSNYNEACLGFNILDNDKSFSKDSYDRYKAGDSVVGSLGIFFLADTKNDIHRMPLYRYMEVVALMPLYKKYFPKRYELVRRYVNSRRWFCPVKFKNFHKVSPIYIKKRYASVDLPVWVAVAISNQEWLTCVQPSNMYKFHLWFNDVAMQFAIKNRKMVIDTELFVYNNQFIKTNYNFEKCSATAGKNNKLNQVEQYGPHLIAFKERWGFDYESPSDDFETVRSRYKGTYVEKLYDHDCRKGPLISYD